MSFDHDMQMKVKDEVITDLEAKLAIARQTLTAIDAFIVTHPSWGEGDEKVILKDVRQALEKIGGA